MFSAPKNAWALKALASTPPVKTFPDDGTTVLYARARRVICPVKLQHHACAPQGVLLFLSPCQLLVRDVDAGSSKVDEITYHEPSVAYQSLLLGAHQSIIQSDKLRDDFLK